MGYCFESATYLPVGDIKNDILNPPETGNCYQSPNQLPILAVLINTCFWLHRNVPVLYLESNTDNKGDNFVS